MRPRRRSDEEILEAGRQIFLERGPSATLQEVAERVGMSQPALSKRFGSKELFMLRALVPDQGSPLLERLLRGGPDERPVPLQLRELCAGALEVLAVVVPCAMTLRASGLDPRAMARLDPQLPPLRVRSALHAWFERAIAEGRLRPCDPAVLGDTLIGALEARALMSWLQDAPLDAAACAHHAEQLVDLLWGGIRPESSPQAAR